MTTPYVFVRPDHPEQKIELERVTTITGMIDKPGIPHWYAKIVARGASEMMAELGEIPTDPDEFWKQLKKAEATPWYETKRAQERGTRVHQWMEAHLTVGSVLPDVPEELQGYVEAGIKWCEENVAEVVSTEQEVYCFCSGRVAPDRVGVGGTLDLAYSSKIHMGSQFPGGALRLADFKTSKQDYPSMHYQLAAYSHAYTEMHGAAPLGTEIVLLREDGTFKAVESKATEQDWLCLLEAYKSLRRVS